MSEKLTIDLREIEIEENVLDSQDFRMLKLGKSKHELKLISSKPPEYLVSINGKTNVIYAARCAEGVWVWHRGKARLVRKAVATRKGHGSSAAAEVSPSMPSVVSKILVGVGEDVERGQGVVVVSAMKMESVLSAPYDGKVSEIMCVEGDNVRPEDILVRIDRRKEDGEAS